MAVHYDKEFSAAQQLSLALALTLAKRVGDVCPFEKC